MGSVWDKRLTNFSCMRASFLSLVLALAASTTAPSTINARRVAARCAPLQCTFIRTSELEPGEDLRTILNVSARATSDEIRSAFRRQARLLHPDVNRQPDAAKSFRRLVAAHDILSSALRTAEWEQLSKARDFRRREAERGRTPADWSRTERESVVEERRATWRSWAPALAYVTYLWLAWGSVLFVLQPR